MYRLLVLLAFVFFYQVLSAQNEEPVTLHTATGDLYGSLILPVNQPRFNLVILQAGSGPTDRRGNNPLGVNADSYWMLAHELAKNNIATLLIDKRGVGASKDAGTEESKLVFDDFIKDLEDWATMFKKDKRVQKLVLAGHSEGSLIAMVAAQKVKVSKYISIAGPAKPIDEIISWQLKQQAPVLAAPADSLFKKLKAGATIDSVPPLLFSLFRPSIRPYMISWMKYSPCTEIKKLALPVLIVQGSKDYQVQQTEGEELYACNPKADFSIVPGMNHVLKMSPGNLAEDRATYTQPALPIVPQLVTDIVKFINK